MKSYTGEKKKKGKKSSKLSNCTKTAFLATELLCYPSEKTTTPKSFIKA